MSYDVDYRLVPKGYYITKDGKFWFSRLVKVNGVYNTDAVERAAKREVNSILQDMGIEPKYDPREVGSNEEEIFTKVARIDDELYNLKEIVETFDGATTERVEEIAQEVEDNYQSLMQLENRTGDLEDKTETIEGEIETLNGNVSNVTGRITTAEGNISTLNSGLNDLSGRVITSEEKISSLETFENNSLNKFSNIDEALSTVNGEIEDVKGDIVSINGKITDISISVKSFGAKGDNVNDDTQSIMDADDYCYANGLTLFFPKGVYKCTNGITRKAEWKGAGAPKLGTFPLEDDKVLLRPGYKTKLPGSVLLFTGTGTNKVTTQRSDEFSEFTYCVKTIPKNTTGMSDIAIVQDMDVKNAAGAFTGVTTDNRSNYQVGYLVEDSPRNMHNNFVVFGYFSVAGIVLHTKETTGFEGDPDYCSFTNGATSGNVGLALIGSQSEDGYDSGLSSTRLYNFNIFSKDHHSRDKVNDDWGKTCLFIDGYTKALNADINGHYFSQCGFRSYCNNTIILGMASNTSFSQCVYETPKYGTPNSYETQFLASEETGDVHFLSCRFSEGSGLFNAEFGGVMNGKIIVLGEPYDDFLVYRKGEAVRLGVESTPFLQLTNNPTSKVGGWLIQKDTSSLETLDFKFSNANVFKINKNGGIMKHGLAFGGTKVISSGNIALGDYSYYAIDTEGSTATDNLATITGGSFSGQRLVLRAANSSRDVVLVKTGNIRFSAASITLDHAMDRVELEFDGTNWVLISFSDNAS